MHVVVAIAVAFVVVLLLVLVAGMSPFLGIPILVVSAIAPALWAAVAARLGRRGLNSDVPSTREASYDPVVDPAERR
jgi:hypothetical protein